MIRRLFVFSFFSLLPLASVQAKDGETFENWTIRCETRDTSENCHLFQNLVMQHGGSSVLHMAVGFPRGQDTPVLLISMPLGISLPPGASIQVDDHETMRFQIERCEPEGCRGGFRLSTEVLAQFEQGQRAIVTFFDAGRQPIEVPVILSGFSEGLTALRE